MRTDGFEDYRERLGPTSLEDDPLAMVWGLVPDTRTPGQRAWDATLPWERSSTTKGIS